MKKTCLFVLLAVIPLVFFSCVKSTLLETPEEEISLVIDPWTAKPVLGEKVTSSVTTSSIKAGFEETKTSLEMNGAGTFAKVKWDALDEIQLYGKSGGSWYGEFLRTTDGGDKATFSTFATIGGGIPDAVKTYCFYAPLSAKRGDAEDHVWRTTDPEWGFGLVVPEEQAATIGGVAKGLNFAYAQADDHGDNLTFRNMLALVHFKMSGAIASSVKSVTLRGVTSLAGDCVLVPEADGTPVLTFSKTFTGDAASTTVTLTGTFTANTDYYFAVVPGTQSSFSLVFSDGGGNSTTKIATKSVTFARGVINDIGVIDLGAAFTDPATPSMETIKWNTASAGAAKPVTIAVIPDGFTAAEMPKYEMLANAAMNTLFNVEPFKSYKNYFNVYILKVASNESGANVTDGSKNVIEAHDCYFGSGWGASSYGDMQAGYGKGPGGTNQFHDIVFDFVTANCPDITSIGGSTVYHTIDEVPVLMIINDTRYGGINVTYSSGRAYCLAPYTYSGGGLSWSYPGQEAVSDVNPSTYYSTKESPTYYTAIKAAYQNTTSERYTEVGSNSGNWLNTMVHEFGGHCFSRLADEYWYEPQYYLDNYVMTEAEAIDASIKDVATHIDGYQYPVPFKNNVSATYSNPGYDTGIYAAAGWQFLLDKKATLVASNPLYNRIGVYQGGDVSMMNRWRSERVSCMIDNRFYFSTFQRYLIVKRIMTLAGAAFDEVSFWAKDVPIDPVRDIAVSPVLGESNAIPPRPVPMLPPPRIVDVQ